MKTKAILSSILIFSVFHLFSQVEWVSIQSPVTENLTSAWMTDSGLIIIVSDEGTIIRSTDGGETWNDVTFPEYSFQSVSFSDNVNGAIVSSADSVVVFTTNDGGENWQLVSIVNLSEANCISFYNSITGVVAGSYFNSNECYYTDDGGQNWYPSSYSHILESVFYDANFRNDTVGNLVGTDGTFYSTNDGGATWAMDVSFPLINLNSIYNFGEQFGVVVGDDGSAFFTINSWSQHIILNTNVTADLNGVWGAPGTNKIWAVGDSGTIIYMDNYLLGWTLQNSGTTENLNDVFILNENSGIAVGDNGTILMLSNPNSVDEPDILSAVFVYPNPSNGVITVEVGEKSGELTVKIKDMNGKTVLTTGMNSKKIKLRTDNLPSGVYSVEVLSSNHQCLHSEKVVIL